MCTGCQSGQNSISTLADWTVVRLWNNRGMDDYKYGMNPEEASELQKESEADLQAELDGGATDIAEILESTDIATTPHAEEEENSDITELENELNNS